MSSRVLLLSTSFPTDRDDSAGHFVLKEARDLKKRGHEVTVVAPNARSVPGIDVHPILIHSLTGTPGILARAKQRPHRLLQVPSLLAGLRRATLECPANHVIAHWLFPCAVPSCRHLTTSLEVVLHGSDVHLALRLPATWLRYLLRSHLPRRTHLRFVSAQLQQTFFNHVGTLPFSSSVRPSPLHVPCMDRALARKRLGLNNHALVAVIVGRLIKSKQVTRGLLHPALKQARWFVIGEGPERSNLERRHPDVFFTGHLPRKQTLQYIAAADWLVHPSEREGAPSVVREARALGVKVLTSDTGDLRQWAAQDREIHIHPEWSTS